MELPLCMCNDSIKYLDKQVWTNSADPECDVWSGPLLFDNMSDQGLYCLTICLRLLDTLMYGKAMLFKF